MADAEFESPLDACRSAPKHTDPRYIWLRDQQTGSDRLGSYLRSSEDARCSPGACRLVPSSTRAELEAVTLSTTNNCRLTSARPGTANNARRGVVSRHHGPPLIRWEACWSPRRWWDVGSRQSGVTARHVGIELNEAAD